MAAAPDASATSVADLIDVPHPPAGKGQVVFFREKSLVGTGQWFNVREEGKALGKLTNGAYFIQITDPGLHNYTASVEPEFKDKLKLEVDPGETYFVEGTLTKGVVIGARRSVALRSGHIRKGRQDFQTGCAGYDHNRRRPNPWRSRHNRCIHRRLQHRAAGQNPVELLHA